MKTQCSQKWVNENLKNNRKKPKFVFKGHHYEVTTNRMEEWKKASANHISDRGFVSRIYEEHLQLNMKMTKDLSGYFSKEGTQVANRYMKSCLS